MNTDSQPNPNRSTGLIVLAMERARALSERVSAAALADRVPLQAPPLNHAAVPPPERGTSDQEPLAAGEKRKR